jgi:membrane-associated phospholipid phosphatase
VFQVGLSVLVAELASILLKLALDRDRPPLGNPDPEPLVRLPHTPSFPSGHATVSFAAATTLAYAVPRYRMAFYALAALIACSRVWVGVHFPLDVLAGAVLGIGIATALRLLLGAPRRSDPPLPPG